MKRFIMMGAVCVVVGTGLVLLVLAGFRHIASVGSPAKGQRRIEDNRARAIVRDLAERPRGQTAERSIQTGEAGPADTAAASATGQGPARATSALRLPSMNTLDRLRDAPQANLRLTEAQRSHLEELTATVAGKADEALSDIRSRQQALRGRLAELGTEDTTGAAVAVQKELAGLLAAERQRLAALDRQFRSSLTAILSNEQMQAVNSMAESDGLAPAPGLREEGGPPPPAPVR